MAGKTLDLPSLSMAPGAKKQTIRLPRTDEEAAIAELIEAPDPGGESEFAWTFKWTRDTYQRALKKGGLTGEIADIGGREVRELLDESAIAVTDAHILFEKATTPEQQAEALRQLRNARAAITVDKQAYVEETDAIRGAIANVLAMVVDIALTIMMPATAGLLTKLAASLIANIGSKVVVLQHLGSVLILEHDDLRADVRDQRGGELRYEAGRRRHHDRERDVDDHR